MLKDLKVLNGELSPKFDPLNNTYTVKLTDNETSSLLFEYDLSSDTLVNIKGNDLKSGENEIILSVTNNDKEETYHIYVYKDTEALSNSSLVTSLEIKPQELPDYVAPLIASICFIIIILTYSILFSRKRKKLKKQERK